MSRHIEPRVPAPLRGAGRHTQDERSPCVHRVVPVWGNLDPARILYTGRFTDYALRATLVNVQVGVAHAGRTNAENHLGALRLWLSGCAHLKRLTELDDAVALHCSSPSSMVCF